MASRPANPCRRAPAQAARALRQTWRTAAGCCGLLWMLCGGSWGPAALAAATTTPDVIPEIRVSADTVQVAEPFTVELRVEVSAGTRVVFPDLGATWGQFDVLQHRDQFDVPVADPQLRLWSRSVTLETIVTGDLLLPSISLQVIRGDQRQSCVTSEPSIRVISVLENQADPTKFREIKDVMDVPVETAPSYRWLLWTVAGLTGLALVSLGVVAVARRQPAVTPRQWAEQELQQLAQSQAVARGDSRASFEQLELTLRKYLEWQFGIPAQQLTGPELVVTLQDSGGLLSEPGLVIQRLQRLLEASERVRFAGGGATHQALASAIEDTRWLVQNLESWPPASGSEVTKGGQA